jgi:thiopeptide-type bacteriocin biosynthesis protein
MSTNQLTTPASQTSAPATNSALGAQHLESAVLEVIRGNSLTSVTSRFAIPAPKLADAIGCYRDAGRAALADLDSNGPWIHTSITFPDWNGSETAALAHLRRTIRCLTNRGLVESWWYVRKAPTWRIRFQPRPGKVAEAEQGLRNILDDLTRAQAIRSWTPGVYEPETWAFGGSEGMNATHTLFCADSRAILDYLDRLQTATGNPAGLLGRRELSMLLCAALLRGAGQDRFETGDVWHRITDLRPTTNRLPSGQAAAITSKVQTLLSLDTSETSPLTQLDGQLGFARPWLAAMFDAGRQLQTLSQQGILRRGLRDILAHQVIFHWNRIGLPAEAQSILATCARNAILVPPPGQPG